MQVLETGFKNAKFRDWKKLVGETGDLADIIVATLSLASAEFDHHKTNLVDFYRIFTKLQEEFPEIIPGLYSTRSGEYVYSKTLADALESALNIGVRIANPQFQFLEVTDAVGKRNLERLNKRVGKTFIDKFRPVANRLKELSGGNGLAE